MKKIILTLAIAFSSIVVFAGAENVNSTVLYAFSKDFTGAKDVEWSASGADFFKAQFVLNSQHIAAFYNVDGELVATTRNITSLDLPLNLQSSLRKDYGNYWISDLFEVSNGDGTAYYITMEKADAKVTLKSSGNGSWNTYKKTTKA